MKLIFVAILITLYYYMYLLTIAQCRVLWSTWLFFYISKVNWTERKDAR